MDANCKIQDKISREINDSCESKYRLSEKQIAKWGFIISGFILIGKLFFMNREFLHNSMLQKNLVQFEFKTDNGEVVFKNIWKATVMYSSLWFPLLCGFLATYFTWVMVYLDSQVPGVEPPSPLSPSKNKFLHQRKFHLNYIWAVVIGIFITTYMYLKGVCLEYFI